VTVRSSSLTRADLGGQNVMLALFLSSPIVHPEPLDNSARLRVRPMQSARACLPSRALPETPSTNFCVSGSSAFHETRNHCFMQTKLDASSMLPIPLYLATRG
jgi:hypothetical protein